MQHSIPTPMNLACWYLVEAMAQSPERASLHRI